MKKFVIDTQLAVKDKDINVKNFYVFRLVMFVCTSREGHFLSLRLWGMGRGLGANAQVTTPGGLGFRRGPLGGGFSPGVGRA
ncbi:hypothetical protein HanPI659440_Chr09g0356441 [Helianthus annuus]|nr:hypothetical protein HanPI659440_Chr09g0356441 [Helianthus annuus]